MRFWPLRRRRKRERLDQTGPATEYGHSGGATAGRLVWGEPADRPVDCVGEWQWDGASWRHRRNGWR